MFTITRVSANIHTSLCTSYICELLGHKSPVVNIHPIFYTPPPLSHADPFWTHHVCGNTIDLFIYIYQNWFHYGFIYAVLIGNRSSIIISKSRSQEFSYFAQHVLNFSVEVINFVYYSVNEIAWITCRQNISSKQSYCKQVAQTSEKYSQLLLKTNTFLLRC